MTIIKYISISCNFMNIYLFIKKSGFELKCVGYIKFRENDILQDCELLKLCLLGISTKSLIQARISVPRDI